MTHTFSTQRSVCKTNNKISFKSESESSHSGHTSWGSYVHAIDKYSYLSTFDWSHCCYVTSTILNLWENCREQWYEFRSKGCRHFVVFVHIFYKLRQSSIHMKLFEIAIEKLRRNYNNFALTSPRWSLFCSNLRWDWNTDVSAHIPLPRIDHPSGRWFTCKQQLNAL